MNNNIKKPLILVETEQLNFLPKEFETRQSIQKKIMSELNKDETKCLDRFGKHCIRKKWSQNYLKN